MFLTRYLKIYTHAYIHMYIIHVMIHERRRLAQNLNCKHCICKHTCIPITPLVLTLTLFTWTCTYNLSLQFKKYLNSQLIGEGYDNNKKNISRSNFDLYST
jgi:hypothetical protein